MKKDNYRKWTILIKYNIINLFKILCSPSDMVNSWWKRATFDEIFPKSRLRLGLRPRPRWRSLRHPRSPIVDCVALLTPRSNSIRPDFDCCPTWEKSATTPKKSNFIGYQYSPCEIPTLFFLSWHAKYFMTLKIWILALDAEKVRHQWANKYDNCEIYKLKKSKTQVFCCFGFLFQTQKGQNPENTFQNSHGLAFVTRDCISMRYKFPNKNWAL